MLKGGLVWLGSWLCGERWCIGFLWWCGYLCIDWFLCSY